MGEYEYDGLVISDSPRWGSVYVGVGTVGRNIPPAERRAAAQALAGDEWRVVSAKQPGAPYPHWDGDFRILGPGVFGDADLNVISVNGENYTRQPDHPEPVDSASVCDGDYVRIEGGAWAVESYVAYTQEDPNYRLVICDDEHEWAPDLRKATVRLLRRAEPDPEEVLIAHQRKDIGSCLCGWGVEAGNIGQSHAAHVWDELVKIGATVGGERQ